MLTGAGGPGSPRKLPHTEAETDEVDCTSCPRLTPVKTPRLPRRADQPAQPRMPHEQRSSVGLGHSGRRRKN